MGDIVTRLELQSKVPMNAKSVKSLIRDRASLVFLALFLAICLFGAPFLIPGGWVAFVLFSFLYVLIVTFEGISRLRKIERKKLGLILLMSIQVVAILGSFSLFRYNVIALPQRPAVPGGMAVAGLALGSLIVFSYLLKILVAKNT